VNWKRTCGVAGSSTTWRLLYASVCHVYALSCLAVLCVWRRSVNFAAGTERAFTGKTVNGFPHDNKARGVYVGAVGVLPLFSSDTKYDSGAPQGTLACRCRYTAPVSRWYGCQGTSQESLYDLV